MTVKLTTLGGSDWSTDDNLLAADLNDTINASLNGGFLSEVKMFALSMTGAITKAVLQGNGWAICDGTTPAAQGISSPTITTTPDLQDKFISMSNDESSGTTGGSATMAHTHTVTPASLGYVFNDGSQRTPAAPSQVTSSAASNTENRPPFYELVFFMKVKIVA